ncbi:hypothetical protein HPP92_007332 [Vanilla planifolia]|uniref:WRKY domain-containing protein n=1 Tax=Vanilla planifolia TaxID=51239 RepID=A0A835V9I5_VANPL|nr:hypothetical protein HPP92_007536 [Vanilla planifolia]KAG0490469.1 hypothetical protein HPP92_007332 [Vanilla planifolia]
MDSPGAEASCDIAGIAVINELTKVRDLVTRLASLLHADATEENNWAKSSTARVLLQQILEEISKATAALEPAKSQKHSVAHNFSSSEIANNSPAGKRKIQGTRRSANRKREHPYAWTRVSSPTIEDGYTWRKYGQKEIYSAKHPRSYYRCTHKYDRGCIATRQVQKSEENPFVYIITYFGEHTCGETAKEMFACRDPSSISFESNMVDGFMQQIPVSSSLPLHKQESDEEVLSNVTSSDSLSDYYVPPELEFNGSVLEQSAMGFVYHHSNSSSDLLSGTYNYDLDLVHLECMPDFSELLL